MGSQRAQLLEAVCDRLGTDPTGTVLHSDNGKPMKGSSMLSTMQFLGIVPSFSRPHVSDDNPFVEAIFRTLKYRPGSAGLRFDTLDETVAWIEKLVHWSITSTCTALSASSRRTTATPASTLPSSTRAGSSTSAPTVPIPSAGLARSAPGSGLTK